MARNNNGTSPTLIHKVILGAVGVIDIGAIIWILTNDVTKMASRRGIAVDGTIIAFAVIYCAILAGIHCFGIFRVASASDPQKAAEMKESRLTGLGEMILFAGLLTVLVGILVLGPGVATWSILLALVMIALGGIAIAVGINRSVLKASIVVLGRHRRMQAAGSEPQSSQPQRQPVAQQHRQQ